MDNRVHRRQTWSCRVFLAAIVEDAQGIADTIAEQIEGQGHRAALRDERCREIFVAEWLRARLQWLKRRASELREAAFRRLLLEEILNWERRLGPAPGGLTVVKASADATEQLRWLYSDLARMHDEGRLTPTGLPVNPGPFIVECCEAAIGSDDSLPQMSSQEGMAILLMGKLCFRLGGDDLGATLKTVAKNLTRAEMLQMEATHD
jgi:hypothetical protein